MLQPLTNWGRVTHICVDNLTVIGSENGLSPGRRQASIWNQCWNIVNWTLGNKLQWKFNQNSNIFIQENVFENVVCEMAFILSRPQCVKQTMLEEVGYQSLLSFMGSSSQGKNAPCMTCMACNGMHKGQISPVCFVQYFDRIWTTLS